MEPGVGLSDPASSAPSPPVSTTTPVADRPALGRWGRWSRGAGRLRGRIIAVYLLLLMVSGVLATVAIGEVLRIRLEDEIAGQLSQEVAEFNRLLLIGNDPTGKQPISSPELAFDMFLTRNVPSQEEGFVAFVGDTLYRSTLNKFPLDRLPTEITNRYGSGNPLAAPEDAPNGRFETELGTLYYRALPVQLGQRDGTFLVMILPIAEFGEIRELQTYGAGAVLLVLLLVAGGGWFVLNRLLRPVEQLTETAQLISLSDLTRRVEVQGSGAAAEMARTVNSMLDRLETVFRKEQEFVRDASHELRVPMTVCLGNLDVLAATLPEDSESAQVIALVGDEMDRMARIVDDLRLLADAGHSDFLHPERIELDALVADLSAKARALGQRRWVVEGACSGAVVADRHRLTEAVMNLVDNAVRHTDADDIIAIGATGNPSEVRIWVRDTGWGVPLTDQARIFDRFRRGARAYRTYRGSGLGLSIVRVIAEAHGGRVELVSTLGEGSTFTLVLPGPAS